MKKFQVVTENSHSRYRMYGETVAEFDTYEEAEIFYDKHHGKWCNGWDLDIVERG